MALDWQSVLTACDVVEAIGRTHLPFPIEEIRKMATKTIGHAKVVKSKTGKAKLVPAKRRTSVSAKIGAKKKADRREAGYRKNRERRIETLTAPTTAYRS